MQPLSSPSSKPNGLFRRFMTWFLDFAACRDSVFRFIWMILTFGYAYPRRRVGENFMYCIVRHVVIFFSRLFCIFGAIYYIYRWTTYAAAGDQRELTTLKRVIKAEFQQTLMPHFELFSTVPNKINVTSIYYTNLTGTYYLTETIAELTSTRVLESGHSTTRVSIDYNLTSSSAEYFEIVVQHQPLPDYPWYKMSLYAPPKWDWKKNQTAEDQLWTDQDELNMYFYQPGYYVEIRYLPIEVHSPPLPGNLFTNIKNFAGFGDEVVTYSYETTAHFKPFPASVMRENNYTADTTVIIIRPQSYLQFIYYTEEKTSFRDTMSAIGGLLSLAGSVIAFLFGAGLMSPWGKLVEMPYFRRKVAGSLAKAYGSEDGISKGPFTSRIEDIGKFDPDMASHEIRITLLKERMDELELVLTEFYLEGDIFQDYASERLQLKKEKHEALVRAASTRNGVVQGGGGPAGQDIPLLPSQKMDEYRRQSISGNHSRPSNVAPLGHSRKFSDSAYPQRQQPLSPPLPLPQSRSSYYGTKQGGGGGRHQQSSSEQSLLRHSDQYSPNRTSDETVNNNQDNNQSMISLLDQQGLPMYHASPMSPTYQHPSQQQGQGHSRYSSSSSSPASPPPLTPGYATRPKEGITPFSVIHEVSGEMQPPTETIHGVEGAGARNLWSRTSTDASVSHGDNRRLSQIRSHQRHSGHGEYEMDMSDMSREP
ncbi:hypothetical protein BGZ81_001643 [Podila clonocystis]|nr:hypothetical protein BGZ81_001643 [Podila clonocystis]